MLKLACVNCGAPLEIGPQLDVFACGFCGSQQQVQRSGGVVALKRVETAIKAVQRGTDRTAAELAMPRLQSELATLQQQRHAVIEAAKERVASAKRGRKKLTWIVFLVVFFVTPSLVTQFNGAVAGVLGIAWLIGCVALPMFVYRKVKLPVDDTAARVAPIEERIQRVQAHLAANAAILDELPT